VFATAHKLMDYKSNMGELLKLKPDSNTLEYKHTNAHMSLTRNKRKRWVCIKDKLLSEAKKHIDMQSRYAVLTSLPPSLKFLTKTNVLMCLPEIQIPREMLPQTVFPPFAPEKPRLLDTKNRRP